MRILDVGTGDGLWPLCEACENPENEYVGIDKEPDHYRLNSPKNVYRWFCGQMIFRAQKKLGIESSDEETGGAILYSGQDFETDNAESDKAAVTHLEKHEKGGKLLDTKVSDVISEGEPAMFRVFIDSSPELRDMPIRELLSYKPQGAFAAIGNVLERVEYRISDLRNIPFADGTFDRVRAAGLVGNYESEEALAEAQRVLKTGKVVRTQEGIDTIRENNSHTAIID